jgi:oligoribonuclease NrnB/cAMP/cGMP phosphodiesterase (DHH superfamily)
MDDRLIDDAALSTARKSQLPGAGFFYPDSLDDEYAERRTREAVADAETVVVADRDADGLACAALVRAARDAAVDAAAAEDALASRLTDEEDGTDDGLPDSAVALVGAGPYNLGETLDRVARFAPAGVETFVCDLCPDDDADVAESLSALVERAGSVRWFDHHQWDEAVAASVRSAGVDLVVGESDEECSADVTLRSLDGDFSAHLRDLVAVTRDHDLWLKEDPRSDDLADYAHWADDEAYLAVVGEHGPDLPETVQDYLAERRVEKQALVDAAVDRATTHEVGPWTVATTYGRCSQNEAAEALREAGADAAVVVKPAGSASLRGSETFERCHEVAALVNGGGHPKASGCKPEIYDDMLDYAAHWTSEGRAARRVILAAFERVAERVEESEGGDEAEPDETAGTNENVAGDASADGDGADGERENAAEA